MPVFSAASALIDTLSLSTKKDSLVKIRCWPVVYKENPASMMRSFCLSKPVVSKSNANKITKSLLSIFLFLRDPAYFRDMLLAHITGSIRHAIKLADLLPLVHSAGG